MRVWRYRGVHRLAWVLLVLLVLAVAVFAMAAGFNRLRSGAVPAESDAGAPEAAAVHPQLASTSPTPTDINGGCVGRPEVAPTRG